MAYTVSASEKLRKSGAEMETKSMLYLMNIYSESDEIYYFVVDFFNDMTGMNRTAKKLWDMQSKGAKNSSPLAIGKELVTLYKNYVSEIEFNAYILFLGGVSSTVRRDDSKNVFKIDNIEEKALGKIRNGLKQECEAKEYIESDKIKDELIAEFLGKVLFVIDEMEPSEYVKKIIKLQPGVIPGEEVLVAIFNEIRDAQASKKNINCVEGITIETTDEALDYCRHLTSDEIRLMVLQRILNRDIMGKGIPVSYIEIYNRCPPEKRSDLLAQCQSACCRALFNKNCADGFWKFFEYLYRELTKDKNKTVDAIYRDIPNDILDGCPDFNVTSFKYFIAIVKDGLEE